MKADIQVICVDIDSNDVGHIHADSVRHARRIAQHYIDTRRYVVQIQILEDGQMRFVDPYDQGGHYESPAPSR